LVNFIFSGPDDNLLARTAATFREELVKKAEEASVRIVPLGPAPCPRHYLRKNYRRHMFIKTRQVQKITRLLTQWEDEQARFSLPSAVKLVVDVDPDDMM